jgi:ATP-dependent RNA helicase DHX29
MTLEIQWSKPQDTSPFLSIEGMSNSTAPFSLLASMDTIATPTSQQAEGFISTYALFLLSTSNTKESKSYLRLPAVWRDLWFEFAESQKQQEESTDRNTVQRLRRLVQESAGRGDEDVVLSDNFRRRNGTPNPAESTGKPLARESLARRNGLTQLWLAKSSTPAYQEMVGARAKLPVWKHKQEILDCLSDHQAVIICSETGSGKSTQIPSFVLENELSSGRDCKIYVTEPRRISAISLARRVSEELGENKNDVGSIRSLVGYAIRLESKLTQSSRLIYA